jgi:hypothetical protein
VRDLAEPVGGDMGYITCFLRDGDRAFVTYSTTGRGNEPVMRALLTTPRRVAAGAIGFWASGLGGRRSAAGGR